MTDQANPTQSPQSPTATPSAQIFTMPEQYRHGKEVKLVEPVKEQKSSPLPPTPPPPPKPPTSTTPATASAKGGSGLQAGKAVGYHRSITPALLIAGAIVLVALGIGGYLLLRSSQKQTPAPAAEQPAAQPISRPAVETPTPEEAPEPTPPETQSPFVTEIVPGKDSDSDGLSDLEETRVYQTNPNLPDTDADGFLDGNEVFHGYNPNGTAPGTLKEAGFLTTTERAGVSIDYPALWETDSSEETLHSLNPLTGEIIYIGMDPYGDGTVSLESLLSLWMSSAGGQENILKTKTKRGQELYLSQDKRFAFLVLEGITVTLRYDLQAKSTIDYLQTFQMMLNSVVKNP